MDGPDQRLADNHGSIVSLLSRKVGYILVLTNWVYTDNVTPSHIQKLCHLKRKSPGNGILFSV